MEIIGVGRQSEPIPSCVATIGFFDGVHGGHRYIIEKVMATARTMGLDSTIITFDRHPLQIVRPGWRPQLLTTLDEKTTLLSQTGIDRLVVLRFDKEMAALSARDFMANVLCRQLGVRVLVTGYDNHFGHRSPGSSESFDDYVRYGRELGINVLRGDAYDEGDVRVSSSKIRQLLLVGDVDQASLCLGRHYCLTGMVVRGEHIGTGLGFPTANLNPDNDDKLIPAPGAYAVSVRIDDGDEIFHGMMNIGNRPTFDGDHQTLETHLFCFSGNLYTHRLTVSFVHRLRSELKFDSPEELAAQLETDKIQAESFLNQLTK